MIKGLDGLRGLSILIIILFHLHLIGVAWVAMQLFYVLSGYLITGILLKSRDKPLGEFSKTFFARRILRIFPAYYLFLAIYFTVATLYAFEDKYFLHWENVLTYTYNIKVAITSTENPLLSHLWSLALEEQFYLVWPFVIYFLPRHRLKAVFIALIVAGPVLRYLAMLGLEPVVADAPIKHALAHAIYKLPSTHLDGFACGALVAVTNLRVSRWLVYAAFATTLAGGALFETLIMERRLNTNFGFPLHNRYPTQPLWGYTVWNILWTLLMIAVINRQIWTRFFECAPMRFIGKISYSMYLVHWPLIFLLATLLKDYDGAYKNLIIVFLTYGLSIAIAALSFYGFEQPIRNLKERLFPYDRSRPKPSEDTELGSRPAGSVPGFLQKQS